MNPITTYLAGIGALGGKAGRGKSKARTSAQARKAALVRWDRARALALDAAGAAVVLAMLVIAWILA